MRLLCLLAALAALASIPAHSSEANDRALQFLSREVERIEKQSLAEFRDLQTQERRRAEAFEMFGLSPMPERGDLKATITGRVENEFVTVEKIHFQSSPGLYVTANLYLPRNFTKPLPTVLYLCGHSQIVSNGVSFGNKVGYAHHGNWFARNGYACLIIDTLQLGEIQGIHHGTHREGMWWWNSRGYSSAAVEAWNSIRALDYLATRSEVDMSRIGVTGRSGGGAYTWSVIALDPRVKAAAPVAGITDLRNHVVDGVVEGHCDCMFFVNTYAWDYHMLAACAAPKPLLIVNTDKDSIFPLDGVMRVHQTLAGLYRLHGNTNDLGLVIAPGPHKDTQDLQVPVFRWFNKHLRGTEPIIDLPATNSFTPHELKVFATIPADQKNTTVQEWFVRKAAPGPAITSAEQWRKQREQWMAGLNEKVFRNWPDASEAEAVPMEKTGSTIRITGVSRPLEGDARKVTHLRRRFMLVGHTVDSMRVFDLVQTFENAGPSITVEAEGDMAVNALFAALFADNVKALKLTNLPVSIESGPDYLNVLRVLDIREALAMQLERSSIELVASKADDRYARETARALGWKN